MSLYKFAITTEKGAFEVEFEIGTFGNNLCIFSNESNSFKEVKNSTGFFVRPEHVQQWKWSQMMMDHISFELFFKDFKTQSKKIVGRVFVLIDTKEYERIEKIMNSGKGGLNSPNQNHAWWSSPIKQVVFIGKY